MLLAALRLYHYGLPVHSPSSWWIAAGCGGLAAGAGGALSTALGESYRTVAHWATAHPVLAHTVADVSIGIWGVASLALMLILSNSIIWMGKKVKDLWKVSQRWIAHSSKKMHLTTKTTKSLNSLNLFGPFPVSESSCKQYEPPPWPPTFSTGVYALGTSTIASIAKSTALESLGRVCDMATLSLWLASTLLAIFRWSRPFSLIHGKQRS